MSNPTTPFLGVRLQQWFPEGDTRRYARNGWDTSRFKPAGTADVLVEICPGEWRPRRIGVLVDEDRRLWACETHVLGPIKKKPVLEKTVELKPKAPVPAPMFPPPRPSNEFLARFGMSPKG